jgi:hypothetical protein
VDPERSLISHVISNACIEKALDHHIPDNLFYHDQSARIWEWLKAYYAKYTACPSSEALKRYFPDYGLLETAESLEFYIDEVRNNFARNAIQDTLLVCRDNLVAFESPYKSVEAMRIAVNTVDDLTQVEVDSDWRVGFEERLARYQAQISDPKLNGLQTPFASLNRALGGIEDGELVYVAAESGVGKTFFLCVLAHMWWQQGIPPIFFSMEMTAFQICRRIDAIHARVPAEDLRLGRLSATDYKKLMEAVKTLKENPFPVVENPSLDATAVHAKCVKHNAKVAFVDGVYLMPDKHQGEGQWYQKGSISKDLKKVAKRLKIPVIGALQLNADEDLAYYKGMRQDADKIIYLRQSKEQKEKGLMELEVSKLREGSGIYKRVVLWDLHNMIFRDVDVEGTLEEVFNAQDLTALRNQPGAMSRKFANYFKDDPETYINA